MCHQVRKDEIHSTSCTSSDGLGGKEPIFCFHVQTDLKSPPCPDAGSYSKWHGLEVGSPGPRVTSGLPSPRAIAEAPSVFSLISQKYTRNGHRMYLAQWNTFSEHRIASMYSGEWVGCEAEKAVYKDDTVCRVLLLQTLWRTDAPSPQKGYSGGHAQICTHAGLLFLPRKCRKVLFTR